VNASDESPPDRTPEEQAILDLVARSNGREWVERHAALILEQARAIGDLSACSFTGCCGRRGNPYPLAQCLRRAEAR
jgi:hypothetical protein